MIKTITKNQCSTPADSMNRLNQMPTCRTGCKKFWKFDRMFLEEWGILEKKRCAIPSSKKGDMIKIITKNQCFTPADSMNRLNWMPTGWTGCQPVKLVAKNLENLIEFLWKSKESMKKNGVQFWVRKREIWSKQARVLRTSTCPYKLQLS